LGAVGQGRSKRMEESSSGTKVARCDGVAHLLSTYGFLVREREWHCSFELRASSSSPYCTPPQLPSALPCSTHRSSFLLSSVLCWFLFRSFVSSSFRRLLASF